jgi:flagellar biosynthesis anti-sigma factor FlgM
MKGIGNNPAIDAYQRMAVSSVGNVRPPERVESGTPQQAPSRAAEVRISAEARELAASQVEGGFDVQKVQALKAKIADGSYSINPQLVAERLLERSG